MSQAVRPSVREPRFAMLVAGEAVNSIGGWASAIVLPRSSAALPAALAKGLSSSTVDATS